MFGVFWFWLVLRSMRVFKIGQCVSFSYRIDGTLRTTMHTHERMDKRTMPRAVRQYAIYGWCKIQICLYVHCMVTNNRCMFWSNLRHPKCNANNTIILVVYMFTGCTIVGTLFSTISCHSVHQSYQSFVLFSADLKWVHTDYSALVYGLWGLFMPV